MYKIINRMLLICTKKVIILHLYIQLIIQITNTKFFNLARLVQ